MFARTLFSLIFANSLPREFKVLANIVLDSFSSYSNSHLRIQEIAIYSEMKKSRNKGHVKISESTVISLQSSDGALPRHADEKQQLQSSKNTVTEQGNPFEFLMAEKQDNGYAFLQFIILNALIK